MLNALGRIGCTLASIALIAASAPADTGKEGSNFKLTVLHNNDGESQLISAGTGVLADFGGVARFATVVNNLRTAAITDGSNPILLSSGDNFLAGPEFNASLANGVPFYDTIAMDAIGYDAICIGNHEFDFGPNVLANFISGFTASGPFLSSNLDFTAEPNLQALVTSGRIAKRTILNIGGEQVGIVGATTPQLPVISSPGGVVIDSNVVAAVQAEVNALLGLGVNKIILISHLQNITEDLALIPQLTGVDIAIAGGGDELLANPGTLLVPGDVAAGAYPLTATDLDGNTVYVITGKGAYTYVGRFAVEFNNLGEIIAFDSISGPVRVAGGAEPDAVTPDPFIQTNVVDPVAAALTAAATTVVATTDVPLDGRRTQVRSRETNYGNLIADALRWQANQVAASYSLPPVQAAIQNGGGIRNDSILPVGDVTLLDTFDTLPFANFVSVLPNIPPAELVMVIENAVSRVTPPPGFPSSGDGRFGQISGLKIVYDIIRDPGQRVRSIRLEDDTPIVLNGSIVPGAPNITIATIDFLANGGDEYPFTSPFTNVGFTYQQALENYMENGLSGVIASTEYPEGGERRIIKIDPDINNDWIVNVTDLLAVIGAWGPCPASPTPCPADTDGDGQVNVADLLNIIASWS